MQSGGGLRAYGQATPMIPFDKAKENGIGFFKALGVNSLAEARSLDAKTVLEKGSKFGFIATWSPTVDGRFLPEEPSEAIMNNHHHDIPYLYGNTGGEYDRRPRSLSELKDFAESAYGEHADEFIRLCNVSSDEELKALTDKDDSFKGRCVNNILFIEKQLELGRKGNYLYYFNPEMPGSDNVGCFHSSDLWFEFESLAKCWRPFKGKHYDLARKMCNYWTNFAKYGNPNGEDADGTSMPEWREYTKDDPFIIFLGDEIRQYKDAYSDLMKFRCDYLFGRL
jgi:para-nitrobenzyl esterase